MWLFELCSIIDVSYSHISVIDERPASWSLQNIVEEILQAPIEGVAFGRLLARDAGALLAQDAAALGRVTGGDEQRAITTRIRRGRLEPHKAHLELLLGLRARVNPAVAGFLHHCRGGAGMERREEARARVPGLLRPLTGASRFGGESRVCAHG